MDVMLTTRRPSKSRGTGSIPASRVLVLAAFAGGPRIGPSPSVLLSQIYCKQGRSRQHEFMSFRFPDTDLKVIATKVCGNSLVHELITRKLFNELLGFTIIV